MANTLIFPAGSGLICNLPRKLHTLTDTPPNRYRLLFTLGNTTAVALLLRLTQFEILLKDKSKAFEFVKFII